MAAAPTYVVLAFDGVLLAVPRTDVRAVEAAADVTRDGAPPGAVGWIASGNTMVPVYCFDADLRRVAHAPAARRVCVVLSANVGDGVQFAVLCDDFLHLVARDAPVQALPAALAAPGSPLRGLLRLESGLACTTEAAILARVLPLPKAPAEAA